MPYQPQQRYLLIEQRLWAKNKAVASGNLTSLLFKLEHSKDPEEALPYLQQLDEHSARFRELRSAILSWLRHVFIPRVAPDFPIDSTLSFSEVYDMIELDPRRWGYKERLEGRDEGREEGLQEGLKRAQLAILLRQLESKFGPLPDDLKERLHSATSEQRETWALQLLQATSLKELFH